MKKIYLLLLTFSAFVVSCSSPYYPEYIPIVSLGVRADDVICEKGEGECVVDVISNVDFEASIISGHEWLSFVDTDETSRVYSGNVVLKFKHYQNNNNKRAAKLVVKADTRTDTVLIKQKGHIEEVLAIDEVSQDKFGLNNGTRMEVDWEGGEYSFRVRTDCISQKLSVKTEDPNVITGYRVENKVVTLIVAQNREMQPRTVNFTVSYVDGWDEVQALNLSIRQYYNPNLEEEEE